MPDQNTPPVSFLQIVKHPVSYALVVVVSLLWYFVGMVKDSSNQVNKNCEAEKVELRRELVQVRAEKDQLTTALLIKNGIIYQQEQDKKELDSTIRNTLGPKLKRIIKEK